MVIELKNDIFNTNEFQGLSYLIQLCFYKSRYSVITNFGYIKKTESFTQLAQLDQEILEQQFNAAIQDVEQIPDVKVSQNITANGYFTIDEAIRYLAQPVSIILENSLNDSYFIEAVIKHLGKGSKLKEHLTNGWIQFENAGGCDNVDNFIEGKAQSYSALPKHRFSYLRCLVILDSDKHYPTQPLKKQYELLRQKYTPFSVYIHILEKRSMENYLPIETFPYLVQLMNKDFIGAFVSLTPQQADFYSIQHGFEGRQRHELHVEIAAHYQSVSDVNYNFLINGCGLGNFKSSFPKLMQHHKVYKETLISRTSHQNDPHELQKIINAIIKLI